MFTAGDGIKRGGVLGDIISLGFLQTRKFDEASIEVATATMEVTVMTPA
jgi:hypothetical protein